MIKVDLQGFDKASALVIRRAEEALIAEYREVAMEVFWRLLEQTPQFTGRAVAHWQIGIDQPDYFRDDSLGDVVDIVGGRHKKDGTFYKKDLAHRKGDVDWMNVAWIRNEHKFEQIHRGTKVFFTNSVHGDSDNGDSSENYMQDLQVPGYWVKKLRSQNKPYETAVETLMLVQMASAPTGAGNGTFTFRRRRDFWKNLA